MASNVLKELKQFEKQEEAKLQKAQSDSLSEIEKAKIGIDRRLKQEKESWENKKEGEINKTREKAMEEIKEVIKEYMQKINELEKKSSKNFKKAVDKIFAVILKNV